MTQESRKTRKGGWAEQPLGKAVRMIAVLARKDFEDDAQKLIAMVAVDRDITEQEAGAMRLDEFTGAVADLEWMQGTLPDPKKARKSPARFDIGGKGYLVAGAGSMSVAQFVDVQTILTRPNPKGEDRSVELMATMLTPVGGRYNEGYDMAELRRAVEAVPYGRAVEAMAFFLNSLGSYLREEIRTARRTMRKGHLPKAERIRMRGLEVLARRLAG